MELEPDMVTIKTEPKRLIPTMHDSREQNLKIMNSLKLIIQFNGRYYFIYSVLTATGGYAVSNRPDGVTNMAELLFPMEISRLKTM